MRPRVEASLVGVRLAIGPKPVEKKLMNPLHLGVLLVSLLPGVDRLSGKSFATRSPLIAQQGVAATSHPLATQIALDILKRGGSAIDAAIAANAALGLMEPTGNGIGGDLYAIVWSARDQKLYGLNASGKSPRGLTMEEFKKRKLTSIPLYGPLPVSVPGCVDGWFELHEKFGKLPMKEVLAPAIGYARDGFPVTQLISYYWGRGVRALQDQPNFASVFAPAPKEGEIFRNPQLANTLERIGQSGKDIYYRGDIARAIDSFCREVGCYLRYEDLAAHSSKWVEPVSTNYRGYDVWELPPNGQGIAALQMLNLLEPHDLSSLGHNSASTLHLLIEAKKIAFEDRAKFYADTEFNKIPVDVLISKAYADQRRKHLDVNRAKRRIPAGNPRLEQGDTIYLTVADKDRNMISLIQSNYAGFGSGLVPTGLGFVLQDRGALFNLKEGEFNSYEPGKRPFHTIIPAFVTRDGKPFMSFGVMGGAMQPQGHVQVVSNIIDHGMNVQEAGDAARFRHTGSSQPTGETMTDGGLVSLESGIPLEVSRALIKMGHKLGMAVGGYGGYQAILYDRENDAYRAASESRKDGMAAGY